MSKRWDRKIRRTITVKMPLPSLVTIGIDPSIRGTALAIVRDGELIGAYAWTDVKAFQKKHPDKLVWYAPPNGATDSDLFLRKLEIVEWVKRIVRAFVRESPIVALEDYAYSKHTSSVSELHELGGLLKGALFRAGVPFRIYDPMSIKLAWAGNGAADKDEMVEACFEAFGVNYSPLIQEVKRKTKKTRGPRGRGPGYDLADATCIAFLAYCELLVKLGRCTLEELDHDLRRVLLRVTKANPEGIASRPWIHARDTSDRRDPAPIFASGEPR